MSVGGALGVGIPRLYARGSLPCTPIVLTPPEVPAAASAAGTHESGQAYGAAILWLSAMKRAQVSRA